MDAQQYASIGRFLPKIKHGVDVDNSNPYICEGNIIRVVALEDSYIQNQNTEDNGLFLPANHVEYFQVDAGDSITVVSGEVNISETV